MSLPQERMALSPTIVICTYNRAGLLGIALDSVLKSAVQSGAGWDLLVVDNNSIDQTREVVERFCERYPGRNRYIFEAEQGLSNARNRGIREARGQIVIFTDDDVTVDLNWLQNLTACFQDEQWAGAGGRVLPPQDFVQPDWLVMDGGLMDSSGVLALFDAGNVPGELKRAPFGANMAFRKDVFERHGTFRAELGRCGDSLIGNEDTEFGSRLMAAGEKLRYEPGAIVYHPVSEMRLNKKYFLLWWYSYGRAMHRQVGARPPIFGVPRSTSVLYPVRARWVTTSPWKSQLRFYWKCRLWVAAGELSEICGQRRKRTDSKTAQS